MDLLQVITTILAAAQHLVAAFELLRLVLS